MQMLDEINAPAPDEATQVFWALFSPCRRGLYAFIKKSLNYSEDADDLYQETVLRAVRYFPGYRSDHPFRTWIYSIAHNELKKLYRHRNRQAEKLPDDFAAECPAEMDPLAVEELRRLHELAMELKPAWREVFFLYYQDGFKVDEVAGITGRSGGHVKFILHRCRKAVRDRLGG